MKTMSRTPSSTQTESEKKTTLRKTAKAARDSLTEEERRRKSARICLRLSEIHDSVVRGESRKALTVCVYRAFGSEANVERFAMHVWDRGGLVAFPCMEARRNGNSENQRPFMTMRLVSREAYVAHGKGEDVIPFLHAVTKSFSDEDDLLSRFPVVSPESADMVVVPLVAFDDEGGRLGYGGGNYDEFLSRIKPEATVVGVGFAEQRVDRVPRESHDIEIPLIVSA